MQRRLIQLTLALALVYGSFAASGIAARPALAATPTARVARGASAVGQPGCTAAACAYMKVTLAYFTPGATVKIICRASNGDEAGFFTYQVRINSEGRNTSSRCYYGYAGRRVWVTANGIESNRLLWPAPAAKKITLVRGAAAPAGYWYNVTLSGFAPGASITVTCRDSVDPAGFWNQTFTINSSGGAADSTLCYSGDHPDHWVTGGGVESNHVTW